MCGLCTACTEIKEQRHLERELGQVSDVALKKMCANLDIKRITCNTLSPSGNPNFELAKAYMKQNPEPCWENIIRVFCEDFDDRTLAKKVQEKYKIPKHIYLYYCR